MLSLGAITKANPNTDDPPEHHAIAANAAQAAPAVWGSYLRSWAPSLARTRPSLKNDQSIGFRNPWPSWHKPTVAELWDSFYWGDDNDGCIELAASHLTDSPAPPKPAPSKLPRFADVDDWPSSLGAKAAQLLRIEDPDFLFPADTKAKVTWLGHAAVLVQLPSLEQQNGQPVRCLFDPIFSMRCAGNESAGPIRSYPPPCKVQDLPPIDTVFISHSHYDHMDSSTITAIWQHSRDSVRFFVPLGHKKWLLEWGISADRIIEMDWWDSVQLNSPNPTSQNAIKIHCTPAQHSSWRSGDDPNATLWSSWYLESLTPNNPPHRVFFAGDTGYQFHPSPHWPPSPNNNFSSPAPHDKDETEENNNPKHPPCPAFAQIRTRIGPPNLLLALGRG
ncbi:hypothetical protein C8A00DRAFT_36760 [Chaetomidium leptoderma]|uniref:Metallo-beta-lactamase domain-containing protein n=1 Tax=Chaetomidium leptoderma TaxID=669021 RepID=A0AAN6VG20_9PEZI|nr:hypothetical protein C8A00DRAFT_36760 [Chaetomidium leptoderma]